MSAHIKDKSSHALIDAAMRDDTEELRKSISAEAGADAKNEALHYAAGHNNGLSVKRLIDAGADANTRQHGSESLLTRALRNAPRSKNYDGSYPTAVPELIEGGAAVTGAEVTEALAANGVAVLRFLGMGNRSYPFSRTKLDIEDAKRSLGVATTNTALVVKAYLAPTPEAARDVGAEHGRGLGEKIKPMLPQLQDQLEWDKDKDGKVSLHEVLGALRKRDVFWVDDVNNDGKTDAKDVMLTYNANSPAGAAGRGKSPQK